METRSSVPTFTSTSGSSTWSSAADGWTLAQKRLTGDLSYMHRPPRIAPNYGKKYKEALRLKTKLPRVLLYDNVTEQTVLEVQLSDIVSQRTRAKRELELQKKSFILRKQSKDKALKNLTKVYHGQDYEQFQQEYYGYLSEGNNDSDLDVRHFKPSTNGSLPDIRVNNKLVVGGSVFRNRKKTKKKRTVLRTNSDNALPVASSELPVGVRETVLPPVTNSHLLQSDELDSSHELSPQRKVGFSYRRGRDGTTRIFHTMSRGNSDLQQEAITAVTDANQPEQAGQQGGVDSVPAEPDLLAVDKTETSSLLLTAPGPGVVKENTFNLSQPLFDIRFELLQKVLVRQDPPNEGFIELSPSFHRPAAPVKHSGRRKKEKQPDRPAAGRAQDDRKSKLSRRITPALSEDNSSESEADVGNEGHNSHADDAIKRLGAF